MRTVKSSKFMDDETFVKHMNAGHMPVAGMSSLPTNMPGWTARILKTWRNYHRYVHLREALGWLPPGHAINDHIHRNPNKKG
jgi:hypothetical protein